MNAAANALLVDVSNGRTKFVLYSGGGHFSDVRMLPTAGLTVASVHSLLQGWRFGRAVVASVVPNAAGCLGGALACPVHWLGSTSTLNVELRYEHPEKLGADRLAGAMALAGRGVFPAISVDAGTAVTFDLVVQGPRGPVFAGGAIAPGLRTMAVALSSGTAQLPLPELAEYAPAVGCSTLSCLQSGLLYGFTGMVDGVLQAMASGLPSSPHIVFTGGDAALLDKKTRFSHDVDKMLVFKGLAVAAELNA